VGVLFGSGGAFSSGVVGRLVTRCNLPSLNPSRRREAGHTPGVPIGSGLVAGCVSRARDLSLGSASQSTHPLARAFGLARRKGDRTA